VPEQDGGEFGRLIPNGLSVRAIRDALKASRELEGAATYAGVPRREVLGMVAGLMHSQGPDHDPKYEKLPELAGRWFKRYAENPKIAARWYSVGAGVSQILFPGGNNH
jgi:hypothetical protein